MGSKSGGSSTTVQKADPWWGVQPYLNEGYKRLDQLYAPGNAPQYYLGDQVATPDIRQTMGEEGLLASAPRLDWLGNLSSSGVNDLIGAGSQSLQGLYGALGASGQLAGAGGALTGMGAGGAMQGMGQLLGAGDVLNNPYLERAMGAAIRPVQEQFTEQVMPGIKQGAIGAGQMGSSRQGVAEGIASRGYLDTIADITSQMGSQAYGQGLQAVQAGAGIGQGLAGLGIGATGAGGQLGANIFGTGMEASGRGTALAPTAQQASIAGDQLEMQIGQQRTAQHQALIDAAMNKWNYQQQLPYSMASDYLSILNGAPGGQTSSSMSGGGGNSLISGLGGAMSGYGLGSGIGTALGFANPWFGIGGALLGGGLGLFG